MKRELLAAGVFGMLCASLPAAPTWSLPFPVGERLVYQLDWTWVPAGETVVSTEWVQEGGRDWIRITLRTETNDFMDKLHNVEDTVESLVYPQTLLPIRVTERVQEPGRVVNEVTEFDRAGGQAHWKSLTTGETKDYAIDANTRDLVSLIYYLRAREIKPGQREAFDVAAYYSVQRFEVEALKNEKLDLPAYGGIASLVLRPTTTSAQLFSRKLPEQVWVSTDPRRLLLRIDARVAIGSVHVVLNRVEGPGSDFWVKPAAETKK